MKKISVLLFIIFTSSLLAQTETINIWQSGSAAASKNIELLRFPAQTENASKSAPALIILPGGGYWKLMLDKEGFAVAEWLQKKGVNAFVLKYTLNPFEALKDAQRAMSVVRAHAKEWNIEEKHIGVIGFSAGGHLAANLVTHSDQKEKIDEIDNFSSMPDFWIGVYGAYEGRQVPPFKDQVDKNSPPAFLVHAKDDPRVPFDGSVNLHNKLKELGVSSELHIYEHGGHGFALEHDRGNDVTETVDDWSKAMLAWLKAQKIL